MRSCYQSFRYSFCVLLALLMAGCTSVQLSDYENQKPQFDMQHYFNGPVIAYASSKIVQARLFAA